MIARCGRAERKEVFGLVRIKKVPVDCCVKDHHGNDALAPLASGRRLSTGLSSSAGKSEASWSSWIESAYFYRRPISVDKR
jgi:hypothetical protein